MKRTIAALALLCVVLTPTTVLAQDVLIAEEQRLFPTSAGGNFGLAVDVDNDTVIVGASTGGVGGLAYIFVRNPADGSWSQEQVLIPTDIQSFDKFGASVSLDGDTALVGAWDQDEAGFTAGAAYVFVRDPMVVTNPWTQQQKLLAGDATDGDRFGTSVAIDGDTALVGASLADTVNNVSGAAYVFVRDPMVAMDPWSQQQRLPASDPDSASRLGRSAALDGDTAVLGEDESAFVFVRNPTTGNWSQQEKLVPFGSVGGRDFGFSVALDGNTAVVGARLSLTTLAEQGSAFVFSRSGTTWTGQQALTADDAVAVDHFGTSVAIEGDALLVGSTGHVVNGSPSGTVYVFFRSGTTWDEDFLTIPSLAERPTTLSLGSSVAMNLGTFVSGSPFDNSFAGSAFVFAQPVPRVLAAPNPLTFSAQTVGTSSNPRNIIITNALSSPVTMTVTIDAGTIGDFDETNDCNDVELMQAETCTIAVTFSPTEVGTRTGEFTVDNSFDNIVTVDLIGEGVAITAGLGLSTGALVFGSLPVGATSDPQNVTVTNNGAGALNISGVSASGDFAQTNDCVSLGAGESCDISATFTPTAGGERSGMLSIGSDDPAGPHTVALSGSGVTPVVMVAEGEDTVEVISQGGTGTYQLLLSPTGFVGDVTLTCSGAPANSTCTVEPNMVTLDGTTNVMITVTVATTAPAMLLPPLSWPPWLLGFALTLLLAEALRRRYIWTGRPMPHRAVPVLAAFLLFSALWTSCGDDGTSDPADPTGGTPTGTSTLLITAESQGQVVSTTELTLTVN